MSLFYLCVMAYIGYLLLGIPDLIRNVRKRGKGRRGYVYAFTFTVIGQVLPVVKIGKTVNLDQRFSAFNTSAPFGILRYMAIRVNDMDYVEQYLHKRYGTFRISNSREWFWLSLGIFFELMILKFVIDK